MPYFFSQNEQYQELHEKSPVSRPGWAVKPVLSSAEEKGQLGSVAIIMSSSHTCVSFWNSLTGWFLLSTVSHWINISSTWQPPISIKNSLIVSGWLGQGIWDQKRVILTTFSRLHCVDGRDPQPVPLLFTCLLLCLSARQDPAQQFSKKPLLID